MWLFLIRCMQTEFKCNFFSSAFLLLGLLFCFQLRAAVFNFFVTHKVSFKFTHSHLAVLAVNNDRNRNVGDLRGLFPASFARCDLPALKPGCGCVPVLLTFSRLSQLYCFGASSLLLPRGTALPVDAVSAEVVVGARSSFSGDFLLDFLEKKQPIVASKRRGKRERVCVLGERG